MVVKRQIGIVESKYRINWDIIDRADEIENIKHPIVRSALQMLEIDFPIEISTFAEVPPNTGLGSSSTFAVGLLHALHAISGRYVSKARLAMEASQIEIEMLGYPIGRQDHYAASYGNINTFVFGKDHKVSVEPVYYTADTLDFLEQSLLMYYTDVKRSSSEILSEQAKKTVVNLEILTEMRDLVAPLRELLNGNIDHKSLGQLLDKGWRLKRSQTDLISSSEIDERYELALKNGATGGKLLGAGGGGFLLLCVPPSKRVRVKEGMAPLIEMPFKVDIGGTRITYYDPMSS